MNFFIFGPKKEQKMLKKAFLQNIVVSYIVGKLMKIGRIDWIMMIIDRIMLKIDWIDWIMLRIC